MSTITTITVDDEQLEQLRRDAMTHAAGLLRHLADHLDYVASIGPWPCNDLRLEEEDLLGRRRMALESLGTLDALGWPEGLVA